MNCPNCKVSPGTIHADDCAIKPRDQRIWSGKLPEALMGWHPSLETQANPDALASEQKAYEEFLKDPSKFRFVPDRDLCE